MGNVSKRMSLLMVPEKPWHWDVFCLWYPSLFLIVLRLRVWHTCICDRLCVFGKEG
jgi:hypothetical protein